MVHPYIVAYTYFYFRLWWAKSYIYDNYYDLFMLALFENIRLFVLQVENYSIRTKWVFVSPLLECLKITSARCFLLKCRRKDSKKVKEHRQFRGVLGRWRTAPIDRTTFHACQRCRKNAVLAVFSRLRGVMWRGKAFREQQCQFLTRNKSLSSENESNCSITSECVRTDSILPRGAGLEHGRCKQSIFSLSIFGILVERLSF